MKDVLYSLLNMENYALPCYFTRGHTVTLFFDFDMWNPRRVIMLGLVDDILIFESLSQAKHHYLRALGLEVHS